MIRQPTLADRSALSEIWSVCFGDSDSYINFFLDNAFDPAGCFVWDEGGRPVAVLYVSFADFVTKNKIEPIMYIYAAATLPQFRGRGIMSRLIDAAAAHAASKGCIFTFLLPASDSLYNYYGKLGFETAFKIKKAVLSRKSLEKYACPQGVEIKTTDKEKIYKLRLNFFRPAVQWRKKELFYALSEWQFTGGDVLCFDGGYALCRKREGAVLVKEACGDFSKIASLLLTKYKSDSFTFMLPDYADYPFETQTSNYGMARLSNPEFQDRISRMNSYANLMLD